MRGPSPRMTGIDLGSFRLRRACRMPLRRGGAIAAIAAAALFGPAQPSLADFVQQGPKLVGTGAVGSNVVQGTSVAVSADGNTAIVGGPQDDTNLAGAVWVYTRSGGVWAQQGSKLVGTGAAGGAHQGNSVAVSADGNTAIVGGPFDNTQAGAVWVFTGSGGVWKEASWSAPARLEASPSKASPSRCRPTATPPSWAGLATALPSGPSGCSPAAAACGPSRAPSWSGAAELAPAAKATPSR